MLDICLLGTGGMMPLPKRFLTSLMCRYNGSNILIDCGEATQIAIKEKGWTVKEDAGRGWRRVVPSPTPIDIVEKKTISELIEDGVIVIAAGGGGIPIYRTISCVV